MDTTKIIKGSLLVGLGFMTGTSIAKNYSNINAINDTTIIKNCFNPTSTNFNNPRKFSLEQLRLNKLKLRSFRNLKSNWNGYDSLPLDTTLINIVDEVLTNLDYQPEIFPTGRGSIQIEKYIDDNNLVEIEIDTKKVFAYKVKNGEEFESEISLDGINNMISDLYV